MLQMKVINVTLLKRFIIKIDRSIVIEEMLLKMNVMLKPTRYVRLIF